MEKIKVCYYCRVSTDQQDYLLQKESLDRVLNNRNDVVLVNIFAEKISGYSDEGTRPEMEKLLKSVRANEVNEVWGYDVSRISRNSINLQIICRECTNNNVNVYFHTQNLNTLNPDGTSNPITKMLIGLLGEFAEQDGKNFIAKGKAGKLTKTRSGNYVGGVLPIGYNYINDVAGKTKKIIIDEKEKKVVQYIFNAFVHERKSLTKICNELNTLKEIDSDYQTKIKTDSKYMYYTSVIRNIIISTWYAKGERTWNNEIIKLDESLIFISMSDYEIALELLKENIRKEKPSKHQYILNEKLYCSCGERMLAKTTRIVNSYVCKIIHNRKQNKGINCVNGKSINIEQSENAVWNLIKNKIGDFKLEVEQKNNKEAEINAEIEHNNLLINSIKENTIINLKEARRRTINTFNKFGGSDTDFEASIKQIDNNIKQQETIINELLSLNTKLEFSINSLDVATEIEKNIQAIEADKNLIKFYINKLIKKITVAGGLGGSYKSLLIIDWNENINGNNKTFLFYKFYGKKQMYYFISSGLKNICVEWDMKNISFNITDTNLNESKNVTIDEMMGKLDLLYDENNEKKYTDMQFFSIPMERYLQQHPTTSTANKTNFMDKPNKLIIEQITKQGVKQVYKFPIDGGIAPLLINTPFI